MQPYDIRGPADVDRAALERFLAHTRPAALSALTRQRRHPRTRPEYLHALYDGSGLVGCGFATHRRLRYGAALLDIGDLTIVAPSVEDALLTQLLAALVAPLPAAGIGWVRLSAAPEGYAALGMAPAQFQTQLTAPTEGAQPRPTLRAAQPSDLEDLAALYDTSYRWVALSEERLRADWDALIAEPALVLEDARGRCVGFARLADGRVVEAAAADAGVARALLRALIPAPLLLAPDHPVARAALHAGWRADIGRAPLDAEADLYGVLDLSLAIEQLAPQLAANLAGSLYAGWQGGIRIELPSGASTLSVSSPHPHIEATDTPYALRLRQVELGGLAQLLLGFRAAADLRATGELQCDDTALGLLDSLFQRH
jgi:hypothetical protein